MTPRDVTSPDDAQLRESVLDIVDRVSEMCFGLFMALTFVGAVSSTKDADAGSTMLRAALGCNLAWGLVDAVMFLIRTLADRGRRQKLVLAVKQAPTPAIGLRVIRESLPPMLRSLVDDAQLEATRKRIAASTRLAVRPSLDAADLLGALRIFCIVVLATFPVALPFVLLDTLSLALLVSRILTLAMLFAGGMALGYYAGSGTLRTGIGMVALGIALTVMIVALGG
jgi:hypothetical protein